MTFSFVVEAEVPGTPIRAGRLQTPHGEVKTPAFMPVGTQGTVKGLRPEEVRAAGAQMILANAYHLYLRPGSRRVKTLGGLHRFMHWEHPILTDSGGFQLFSLVSTMSIGDEGVEFRSHVDGSRHFWRPEDSIAVQEDLGADIIMAFDQPVALPAPREQVEEALERTLSWARRSLEAKTRSDQALFGIVQGGLEEDLRRQGARELRKMPFAGYAVGGLSVGEGEEEMYRVLEWTVPELPWEKPRYLMGVGLPRNLVEGVRRGIDLFDCVLPTRMGRTGTALLPGGRLNLRNAAFAEDPRPIQEDCDCYTCRHFSRGYLRHLVLAREILGLGLVSLHNVRFLIRLMEAMRQAILQGEFWPWLEKFYEEDGREVEP
ncbi:MAG: tRNA guanosine(34) transglycosylase Tgt [Bacillota bacterium]|nr:tRNA guanosine(34) transglycosylase Tgt [Bacillota bacterium]